MKRRCTIFTPRVAPVRIQQKLHRETLHRTNVFTSCGICGSHSAFRCIQGVKCQQTIFHVRVGPLQIQQNRTGTRYAELVFLHPLGSMGHVVHSSASGVRNFYTLFFMLGRDRFGFNKKRVGRHYTELVFLHPMGSTSQVVHSGVSGHEMSMHYFSCSGGTGRDSIKIATRHVTPNLCFCIRCYLWVMSCILARPGRKTS
jgi:hypothetical protein